MMQAPNPAATEEEPFLAYASRLQLIAVTASMLPFVVVGICALPLLPGAPLAARLIGLVIIAPIIIWLTINMRLLGMRDPVIEVDRQGLLWRRWSPRRIDWDAVAHWEVKRHMRVSFVTFWLKDPSQHRSTTIHRLLAPGNRLLGMGDVTLNAAGTHRSFEALLAAVERHAPPQRLPDDPRLVRRILNARRKRGRGEVRDIP
jgi:hypothetical protein